MQRRPPTGVATVQECRIAIQQVANLLDIVALRGRMDEMVLCRGHWSAAPAELLEELRDLFITPIPGDFDQAIEVTPVPFRVSCACVQQNPHGFGMPFP